MEISPHLNFPRLSYPVMALACPFLAGIETSGSSRHFVSLDSSRRCKYNVVMKELRFEWDPGKSKANQNKHGVSFEEAYSVFYDEQAVEFYDDENSEWEDRFLLLGISAKLRMLMICHCYRVNESVIRIISARKATKKEARYYQG